MRGKERERRGSDCGMPNQMFHNVLRSMNTT